MNTSDVRCSTDNFVKVVYQQKALMKMHTDAIPEFCAGQG